MAKNKLRPLNDKIVVKRLEAEEKTKGGIVLPDTAKEKPREGKVVSVGGGKVLKDGSRAEFQVKKNDRIIFSSYAGTEINAIAIKPLGKGLSLSGLLAVFQPDEAIYGTDQLATYGEVQLRLDIK